MGVYEEKMVMTLEKRFSHSWHFAQSYFSSLCRSIQGHRETKTPQSEECRRACSNDRSEGGKEKEREREGGGRQEWEKSGKRRKKKEKEGERKERRDISYVLIKLARNRATTRSTSWIFYEGYHERATAPYTILSPTCNPSSPFHLSIFSFGHACNSRFFLYRPVEEAEEDTRSKKQSDLFCMWITGSGTF